jgi:mono/diheme cytochrome c family protein
MKTLRTFSLLLVAATAASAAPVTIELPPGTATFKPAKGAELAQANCLICHSSEYISSQPPMPRKFWEANVKKMTEKYAAPTPPETVAAIVDYLVASYGVPDAPPPSLKN